MTGSRCLAAALAASVLALALPAAAGAHAVLVRTVPSNDTVTQTAPDEVRLSFNEPVETAFGSIRVYDAAARRYDDGRLTRPDSRSVAVGVDGPLGRGTYTVTWRALSADSHPVSGAFVFHVKEPGANAQGIARILNESTPRSVNIGVGITRFLDFSLLLLLAGGAGTLVWALTGAAAAVRGRLALVLAVSAAALAVVALAGIVLQGASAAGFTIGQALDWRVFRGVLDTHFGKAWLAQAIGAAGVCGLALLLRRRPGNLALAVPTAALAAALLVTPTLAGHARTSGATSMIADVVHLFAASAWTGGLVFMVLALLWAASERWTLATRAVPRYSTLAVVSVVALIVAGTINGYLQVGTWRGLWDTTYGLLLLAKIGLVLPLLAIGAYNNRWAVPRLRAGIASVMERRRFLRAAAAEMAIMAAVVAVTAVLVAEPPAKATVTPKGPYATEAQLGSLDLNLVVDPGEAGTNAIHIYLLDGSGRPAAVADAKVSATLPSREIGPLKFRAMRLAPGHYSVYGADLAVPGDWRVRLEARRGEFESLDTTLSIPIREDS